MGLRAAYTQKDFDAALQKRLLRLENAVMANLNYVGEMCVAKAREAGNYKDRTANLRNSTGYAVFKDGKIVRNTFQGQEGEGAYQARRIITKTAKKNFRGYGLVVVAGMKYASFVESRGYDVLTSAELLAETLVPQLLNKLKRSISKA